MKTLALIGVGAWGKNIVATIEKIPGVRLKYLGARTKESLAPYPDRYQKVTDWRDIVEKKDIDAVLIATPPGSHASIAVPFLERGLPVFIEKPVALTVPEAKRIERAAKKGDGTVFVGHIHIYNPAYRALKVAVTSCGAIESIESNAGGKGPFRDDYSALWDYAPHDVSMALDLVGKSPVSLQAWGESITRPGTKFYDTCFIRLLFARNLAAVIRVSWIDAEKHRTFTVHAGKSIVAFNDFLTGKKVTVFRNILPERRGGSVVKREPITEHPAYSEDRPLTVELTAFLHFLETGRKPETGIKEGIEVVKVLAAAEKSIANGGKKVNLK